ncbi:hypothetical protein E4U53_000559 [Claviceps sorghi]|nr:hypothetical protein E4U53_000559 [Claviceps sorghi]
MPREKDASRRPTACSTPVSPRGPHGDNDAWKRRAQSSGTTTTAPRHVPIAASSCHCSLGAVARGVGLAEPSSGSGGNAKAQDYGGTNRWLVGLGLVG